MGREINYDDLFKGLPSCGTHHVGTYPSHNGIGAVKEVTNCVSSYDEGDFSNNIPAVGAIGYHWNIKWHEGSKKGDWCYLTQTLPKFYAGGLFMNYTLSKDVQFVIRTTQDSGNLVTYYNHTSLLLGTINSTVRTGISP